MFNYNDVFKKFFSDRVLFDEPMSMHTTFKIGGNADIFIKPETADDIKTAVELCGENNIPYYIIGNGSNIIVSDNGFRGVIIQLYKNFSGVEVYGNVIKAQSGALLSAVAAKALRESLCGMEFASGIPGTVGGAVCMNAGAYGGEMKDIVVSVKVIDKGRIVSLSNCEACFEYRNSRILKEKMIVLSAEIKLEHGEFSYIKEKMNELNKKRSEKQPVELPSAGSTFKRPEGYFAGKLIMDSGLRGFSIGGASVSEKHCGFIVNNGGASAKDVINLIEHVKSVVYEKFGVMLEPEIRIIGEI